MTVTQTGVYGTVPGLASDLTFPERLLRTGHGPRHIAQVMQQRSPAKVKKALVEPDSEPPTPTYT